MIDWLVLSPFLLFTIAVALLFDFYNGLHDAANSIATVVATRALPVWGALLLAASFNFLGAFVGTAVAAAIGKGIIDPAIVSTQVVLAALIGAIFWSVLTVVLGIPISSSQSLVGGLIGAGLARAGASALQLPVDGELAALGHILGIGALVGACIGLVIALAGRVHLLKGLLMGAAVGSAVWLVGHILGVAYLPGTLLAAIVIGGLGGLVVGLVRKQHRVGSAFLGVFILGFVAVSVHMMKLALPSGDGIEGSIQQVFASIDDGMTSLVALFGIHSSYQVLDVAAIKLSKLTATILFIAYSPFIGFCLAFFLSMLVAWSFHHVAPGKVKHLFRWLQIGSSSFYSLGHGRNDAQKTMGVITALLVANGALATFEVPYEVIVASGLAIALGTLIGGHRIVRTMGGKLTHLDTSQGFCAETASAISLTFLADKGVPVSTTHSITGSILGVGTFQRVSAVSWGVARRIVMAWVITIPLAAGVAALVYWGLGIFL